MRKKIELEDMIGIVKTDEVTNSVELKKEVYTDTKNKRFEVVLNEFDEVEYIMDKEMMEDRDFAEFIDFVEDVCKENEQLKKRIDRIDIILDDLNGAEYISRDDAIKALNKIDKVVR